jgi:hypothetical protein
MFNRGDKTNKLSKHLFFQHARRVHHAYAMCVKHASQMRHRCVTVRSCGESMCRLLSVLSLQAFTTTFGMDERQYVEPQDNVTRDPPIVNIISFESYSLSLNTSQEHYFGSLDQYGPKPNHEHSAEADVAEHKPSFPPSSSTTHVLTHCLHLLPSMGNCCSRC